MKSKDLQKLVFCKQEKGDGPTKIFRDLNGFVGLRTIHRWCKMSRSTGSIQLSTLPGAPGLARTNKMIEKVKHRLNQHNLVSARSLSKKYNISKSSTHRILKEDLKLNAYKIVIEPKLTNEQKDKRKKFANWVFNNF